jgi:RNA polymerase sigma factor (sigma-70 family)
MTTALGTGLRRAAARLAPDPAPDGELLARFLASRDETAFAVLVRRHAGMVFGTCQRVLGNAADADDAFQAAFVVLVRKAHSLTDRACVGNFLYGVAFHTALKARAMATKRRAKEGKATRPDSADTGELTRVLDEELSKLPDKYREPVVLCELDGVSRKEAADRLGIPEGTVSSRLATAHRMLAKRLTARGFAAGAVAAVLGNQAFAVPDVLTAAAVRAAAGDPSGAVTTLASEVSKMLLWNKLKAGAVLAGVLLACGLGFGLTANVFAADDKPAVQAPVPAKVEAKTDEDRIQGVWEAETVQVRGKQVPASDVYKLLRWKFHGTTLSVTTGDGQGSMVFELDATASPKTLATSETGAKKVKAPHAIYDLDGDTLKVCHNTEEGDAGPIPTSFRAGPQDKDELIVFKRVKAKDDKAKPAAKGGDAKKPDDAKLLQGKWVTKAVTFDPPFPVPPGAKHTPAQHALTFTDTELTWVTFIADDVKTRHEQIKPFKLDQTTSPKELTSGVNECVYELDGDTLKVAMHFLTPGRPKGFNAKDSPPGKGHVILIELTREKEEPKKEEKLLGKWKQSGVSAGGGKIELGKGECHWVIGEDQIQYTATNPLKEGGTFRYTASPDRTPAELTTTNSQGEKRHHIYKLDGDTLTVAFFAEVYKLDRDTLIVEADPKNPPAAPKGFTAKDVGDEAFKRLYVVTYERVKEDKKPEADKSYSLKDGEVLKLIAAPFPDERDDIYTKFDAAGGIKPAPPAADQLMTVTVKIKDGQPLSAHAFTDRKSPGSDTSGKPLTLFFQHALRFDMAYVADPNWLLESTILDADVVVRAAASPTDMAAGLEKELAAKCGVKLSLTFEDAEREVVVITGKHTLKADPPTNPSRVYDSAPVVHFFAGDKQPQANSLQTDTRTLPGEVAKFVGRRLIDESDLGKKAVPVTITFHDQYPATDKTRAADRDPAKVLQNLANQTGLTFKLEKRKVLALVVAKADKEPAWKADFRKAYGLKDGQLVRRVAPPYPDCREAYFKDVWPNRQGNIPFADWFSVFNWKGDWTDAQPGQFSMPTKADAGVSLERLLDMTLKFPRTRVEGPADLLAKTVTGDFVARAGADPEKAAAELEAVLRKELQLPVAFSFKDAEEDVYVLSGKYTADPLEGKKAGEVEVYAVYRNDGTTGGGGSGTLAEMLAAVERHVGHRVAVGKVDGEPKKLSLHINDRVGGSTKQQYDQDHDAPTVLTNIATQTGLTMSLEKRKVRALVVEQKE